MALSIRRKLPPFVVPFNPDEDETRALRVVPPPLINPVPPVEFNPIADYHAPTPNLDELGPPPIMIRRNNKQRPLEALGGADDLERDTALYDAQSTYKAPRSTKDFLLRLATGLISGGLPGAAAQGLGYELNQDVRNQDAVGSDMARTRGRIETAQDRINEGLKRRRAGLQNELTLSQIAENQVQAARVPTVKLEPFPVDTDGDGIPDREEFRPVVPGAVRNVYQKPRAERAPILKQVQNPDGTISTKKSTDNGASWVEVPELTSRPAPKDDIDPSGNIQAARDEQAKIDAGLAQIAEQLKSTPPLVDGYPNPAYEELNRRAAQGTSRRQHLDDQIRGWSMKARGTRQSATADPLKGVKWSKSRYRGSKPIEQAAREAAARGAVVVP